MSVDAAVHLLQGVSAVAQRLLLLTLHCLQLLPVPLAPSLCRDVLLRPLAEALAKDAEVVHRLLLAAAVVAGSSSSSVKVGLVGSWGASVAVDHGSIATVRGTALPGARQRLHVLGFCLGISDWQEDCMQLQHQQTYLPAAATDQTPLQQQQQQQPPQGGLVPGPLQPAPTAIPPPQHLLPEQAQQASEVIDTAVGEMQQEQLQHTLAQQNEQHALQQQRRQHQELATETIEHLTGSISTVTACAAGQGESELVNSATVVGSSEEIAASAVVPPTVRSMQAASASAAEAQLLPAVGAQEQHQDYWQPQHSRETVAAAASSIASSDSLADLLEAAYGTQQEKAAQAAPEAAAAANAPQGNTPSHHTKHELTDAAPAAEVLALRQAAGSTAAAPVLSDISNPCHRLIEELRRKRGLNIELHGEVCSSCWRLLRMQAG